MVSDHQEKFWGRFELHLGLFHHKYEPESDALQTAKGTQAFGLALVRLLLISEKCYAFVIVQCERNFFDPSETLKDTLI